jgi:phosphatidate cytidylyltransferase
MVTSHAKRWLSAVVSVPLLVFMILKGGETGFAFLVGLGAAAGLWEYYGLALPSQPPVDRGVSLVLGVSVITSFYVGDMSGAFAMLPLVFFVSAAMGMRHFKSGRFGVEALSKEVTGYVYVPFLLGHLVLIRAWDTGVVWTFFLLAVVFAGDTGAYYVGRAFGQHKLSPAISPGKTVEGAVGGLGSNFFAGLLFKYFWLPEVAWIPCGFLILLMGLLGQVGDLTESMLKRSCDSKDSGRLLPGHGGMLDRLDSLLFAAPGLYYYKTYVL